MKNLIAKIKEKQELKSLDDNFIKSKLDSYFQKNPKAKTKFENVKLEQFFRSKEFSELKKELRKNLRESYGVFDVESKDRDDLLKNNNVRELLATHQSTKERLPYYNKIYKELFNIVQPKIILDIGCGLNPVSYELMKISPEYFCCDISSKDMDFLNRFFEKNNIKGSAFSVDAVNNEPELLKKVSEIKPDTIFMFKLLDTLETIKRHHTKKLLPKLAEHTNNLIVSFATISLGGGKKIPESRRTWFEKYLAKIEWEYEIVEVPNEIFYVIKIK